MSDNTPAQRRWTYWQQVIPMCGWTILLREPWWVSLSWRWSILAIAAWSWWAARKERVHV